MKHEYPTPAHSRPPYSRILRAPAGGEWRRKHVIPVLRTSGGYDGGTAAFHELPNGRRGGDLAGASGDIHELSDCPCPGVFVFIEFVLFFIREHVGGFGRSRRRYPRRRRWEERNSGHIPASGRNAFCGPQFSRLVTLACCAVFKHTRRNASGAGIRCTSG